VSCCRRRSWHGSALAHLLRNDASSAGVEPQFAVLETGDQKLAGQCLRDCLGPDQPVRETRSLRLADSGSDAAPLQHHDADALRGILRRLPLTYFARGTGRMRPSEHIPRCQSYRSGSEYHVAHFAPLGCTFECRPRNARPLGPSQPRSDMPGLLRTRSRDTCRVNGGERKAHQFSAGERRGADLHGAI